MNRPLSLISNTWRKNWPEVHAGLTGGLPRFVFSRQPEPLGHSIPVFCYHVIDAPTFRADLAFLNDNGYTTLTADDLLEHLEQRKPVAEKSMVLSFDDGQRTLFDLALPLLKEYNHRAIAFICPGLHREPGEETGDGGLCDWSQIHRMHDSGHVDFQPHTHSHRYIPDWPRPLPLAGVEDAVTDRRRPPEVSLQDDLRAARQAIEDRLDKTARHLAFPQYNGNDDAIAAARALGYEAFYWGVLPGRALNEPAPDHDATNRIVRISGEFVRRLPGRSRVPLKNILSQRYFNRSRTG